MSRTSFWLRKGGYFCINLAVAFWMPGHRVALFNLRYTRYANHSTRQEKRRWLRAEQAGVTKSKPLRALERT